MNFRSFTFIVFLLIFCGCRVHEPLRIDRPTVCVPETYENAKEGAPIACHWWEEFELPQLNCIVQEALANNLEVSQAWWRVVQRCYQTRIEASLWYPTYDVRAAASGTNIHGDPFTGTFFGVGDALGTGQEEIVSSAAGQSNQNTYIFSNLLGYEVDLWRRIDSNVRAACLEMQASREDMEAVGLTLTGTVVDLWFTINEQIALLKVIDEQIEVSKTLLELVELRFSVGVSSALDVYQQRLQLANTVAQKPPIQSVLETAVHELDVLLARPPENYEDKTIYDRDLFLPPFPDVGLPVSLLNNRPDLRALFDRLKAADYVVAAAIADRFPRLDLFLTYDFRSSDIKNVFQNSILSYGLNLIAPILDGGARAAEVGRTKAVVCEILMLYGQTFLDALREVEDAIVREKYQLELIKEVKNEIEIAEKNLEQATFRYTNGLVDYLTVIAAVQSLQDLQRQLVVEQKNLLSNRATLYRALGGPYLYGCPE